MTSFRNDPYRAYNFLVSFVDSTEGLGSTTVSGVQRSALGGFAEVSGIEMSLDVEEYNEGGRNDAVRQFPTRMKWTNLRLKRGLAFSDDLWSWHQGFLEGRGVRRDGIIVLQDETGKPARVWHFRRGLPVKWTGPSLNALRGDVAFEEIEIAHEGMRLEATGALMGAGELASVALEAGTRAVGGVREAAQQAAGLFDD